MSCSESIRQISPKKEGLSLVTQNDMSSYVNIILMSLDRVSNRLKLNYDHVIRFHLLWI